jgi:protein KRI1
VSEPTQIDISRAIENKEFDKLKGGDMELDELIDDYANLDFEDVIAGGIKTRFSYTEVPKESFMLTDEELLYCDDKVLNKFLALKKIVPYKDQEVM